MIDVVVGKICKELGKVELQLRFIQVMLLLTRNNIHIMMRFVKDLLRNRLMSTRIDLKLIVYIHETTIFEARISWDLIYKYIRYELRISQYIFVNGHHKTRIDLRFLHIPPSTSHIILRLVHEFHEWYPYDSSTINLRIIYEIIRLIR